MWITRFTTSPINKLIQWYLMVFWLFSRTFRYETKIIFQAKWCVNIYHSDRNSRTPCILRILKHKKSISFMISRLCYAFLMWAKITYCPNNSVAFVVTQMYTFAFFSMWIIYTDLCFDSFYDMFSWSFFALTFQRHRQNYCSSCFFFVEKISLIRINSLKSPTIGSNIDKWEKSQSGSESFR